MNKLIGAYKDKKDSSVAMNAVKNLKAEDPGLPGAIAAESLKGLMPSANWSQALTGFGAAGAGAYAASAGAMSPWALALGIPASPAVLRRGSKAAGYAGRPLRQLEKKTGIPQRAVPHAAAQVGTDAQSMVDNSEFAKVQQG